MKSLRAVILLTTMVLLLPGLTAPAAIPNANFDQGTDAPAGWKLVEGRGNWVDRQMLAVTGDGKDTARWQSEPYQFTPGGLYRFQVRARRDKGTGSAISGPEFANCDYDELGADWRWLGQVFRVPDGVTSGCFRVGHWQADGTLQFDAARLTAVLPVYLQVGGLTLGQGESIRGDRYAFDGSLGGPSGNFHRTLYSTTAYFNSNRWCFGDGNQVTHQFSVPSHAIASGTVRFNVNYHTGGECALEISRDHDKWRPIATQKGVGTAEATLPAELLPADTLLVRLRASGKGASFQVDRLEFDAKLTNSPDDMIKLVDLTGRTLFAELDRDESRSFLESIGLAERQTSGGTELTVNVKNPTTATITVSLEPSGAGASCRRGNVELRPGNACLYFVDLPDAKPGENAVHLKLAVSDQPPIETTVSFTVPEYYRDDYGERIEGIEGDMAVWWCPATWKIAPRRRAPEKAVAAATLSAARDDHEAVQIVVRPGYPLKGLTATAAALAGPDGATIPAENVKILRVYYHFVEHPTDATGVRDRWPDALPPLTGPIDVAGGDNQPLWVLVHVPRDAKPGDYTGQVSLAAEGFSATVPLRLHVWNFVLPERNHLSTAFGFSPGLAFRYHGVKSEADKRRLLDLYFQSFAEHRISPYDPVPMDPIGVKFLPEATPPRAELDFTTFDAAMARAIEKYHFTGYRVPIHGMGGGTFHSRSEPDINGLGEATPQYQAMFSSCVKQLEDHLKAKGWLDMAYVYWFDEPDPKDYAFVTSGMQRLKKYAPGLSRMLTEQPNDDLDAVDIWCPITPNFDAAAAERRRAHGERFWWYVCTGPKAPFCTLFIDHPATELRVWHWQTWQRGIVGTLVWETNYWTSSAAFPDKPQNPYEDPMGYVSGYSTPTGAKHYWGNGDGRFIYPPLAAATPGTSSEPVLEGPVSSIRWEMLREGVEDYEYLYLLRQRLDKRRDKLPAEEVSRIEALLKVPESITKDMTTFTTDPAPIHARRAAVAEAIERLE
jgi:hypothetical protein